MKYFYKNCHVLLTISNKVTTQERNLIKFPIQNSILRACTLAQVCVVTRWQKFDPFCKNTFKALKKSYFNEYNCDYFVLLLFGVTHTQQLYWVLNLLPSAVTLLQRINIIAFHTLPQIRDNSRFDFSIT